MKENKKCEESYVECPNCGRSVNKEENICPYCHYDLENRPKIKGNHFYEKEWFRAIVIILIIAVITIKINTKKTKNSIDNGSNNIENIINSTSNNISTNKLIKIIDFSQMTQEEIEKWCKSNNLQCNFTEAYSDSVEKGSFVSQSIEPNESTDEGKFITIVYSKGKEPSVGQKNALAKAKSYLAYTSFSYKGLIKQLEFEGFSYEEALYGVDNCDVDWKEQAAKKAKSYMDYSSFSRSGLIKQLEFEGFTNEQAEYGASAVGY